MKNEDAFRAACLAATVAVAWTISPSTAQAVTAGTTVYLRSTGVGSGGPSYSAGSGSSGGEFRFVAIHNLTYINMVDLGEMPLGDSSRSFIDPADASTFDSYALIGVGTGSGGPGSPDFVCVTFKDQSGIGSSFESLFPGFNEADVATAIRAGDSSLNSFLSAVAKSAAANTTIGPAVSCTCTHLSVGVADGQFTASFTPLPEPGAMMCIAGLGFGALRRRPRAAGNG
jgi:hypothetical protein